MGKTSFPSIFSEEDVALFGQGTHPTLYKKFGAHNHQQGKIKGTRFAVWAPAAQRVYVVGDFNNENPASHPLQKTWEKEGIWETFIPWAQKGQTYQYRVIHKDRALPLKSDPFAFKAQHESPHKSIINPLENFCWKDDTYLKNRPIFHPKSQNPSPPLSIYEVHLDSWCTSTDKKRPNYQELARLLIPYVKEMEFTHIEILPLMEHPFGGSWGYQPTGLFAPTSRFGDPDDFRSFVNEAHKANIGIILDWVPGHFPSDAFGLSLFDGTPLFGYKEPLKRHHPEWKTLVYDYGKPQVRNFLIASALFWLNEFHIDGLRIDAVSSILYLDYSRAEGQWQTNIFGGKENLEGIKFFHDLHTMLQKHAPQAFTLAEESSHWEKVSHPLSEGGLGFSFKWNMGWANDTQRYLQTPFSQRKAKHQDITFSLWYAHNENFCLPLSHDEVCISKKSLLQKSRGNTLQKKYADLRAYYAFFFAHPGAKLLFMGSEWATPDPWAHTDALFCLPEFNQSQLQQALLKQTSEEKGMRLMIQQLNHLYQDKSPLHCFDSLPKGFLWTHVHDSQDNLFVFLRYGKTESSPILVVVNFSPKIHKNRSLHVPMSGVWRLIFNSDHAIFKGTAAEAKNDEIHQKQAFQTIPNQSTSIDNTTQQAEQPSFAHEISVTIPALSTLYFEYQDVF